MKFSLFFASFLTLISSDVFATSEVVLSSSKTERVIDSKKFHFAMPKNFNLVHDNISPSGQMIQEWVPENESLENWSKMITILRFPNLQNNGKDFLEKMAEGLKKSPETDQVEVSVKPEGMTVTYYLKSQQKHQLLVVKTKSTQDSLWVLQCTVDYNPREKDQALKTASKLVNLHFYKKP